MRHSYARKIASGVVITSLVVTSSMTSFAKELETEIPSVGSSVLIDEYLENNGTEDDLVSILPAEQTYVATKEGEETQNDNKTKEDALFNDIAITSVAGGEEDYVNVRKKPNADAKRVGKIFNNCGATIKETTADGWYKVVSGNCVGYIKAEFFVTGSEAKSIALDNGYVIADIKDALHVREKANKDSDVVTNVYANERYTVKKFDSTGQWIKIKIGDGVSGWISADYADVSVSMETAMTNKEIKEEQRRIREAEEAARRAEEEARAAEEAERQAQEEARQNTGDTEYSNPSNDNNTYNDSDDDNDSSSSNNNGNSGGTRNSGGGSSQKQTYGDNGSGGASDVVSYAKQFLGNPYVYGGSSLTSGTDCSGFVMSVYAHFGYSLNRVSAEQSKNGRSVSLSELQPGDLLFYNYDGSRISHVAMYIGGGQIIHASTEETGIIISGMGSPCCARRIVG